MSPGSRKRDEPVRLTRIYTRGGDAGETSRGDGSRVPKTDPHIVATGVVDEVNANLGLALAAGLPEPMHGPLERIQNELFDLGADLAVPLAASGHRLRVTEAQVRELERLCDQFNADLPPLKSFVLPGGSEPAARLHVCRTVCRRAEIAVHALGRNAASPLVAAYLNRLSDLFFILARAANAGRDEPLWKPGGDR